MKAGKGRAGPSWLENDAGHERPQRGENSPKEPRLEPMNQRQSSAVTSPTRGNNFSLSLGGENTQNHSRMEPLNQRKLKAFRLTRCGNNGSFSWGEKARMRAVFFFSPTIFIVTRSRQRGQCEEWKFGVVQPMPGRPMTLQFWNPSIHSYA